MCAISKGALMIRTARWLIPLVLLGGCTSTEVPDPRPSPPAASAVALPAQCPVASVAVGEPSNAELTFTQARSRTVFKDGSVATVDLVDQTVTPSLTWRTSPAPKGDDVFAAIVEQAAQPVDFPTSGPQDNSDTLSLMLASTDDPDGSTTVGYTSVVTADYAVTVGCEGGGTAQGTLSTWSDHETGVVSCDVKPSKPSSAARAAHEQHCSTE